MIACKTSHDILAPALHDDRPARALKGIQNEPLKKLVAEQANLSAEQLYAQHKRLFGPQGVFDQFNADIERLGRQAPALEDMTLLAIDERIGHAEQALAFVLAQNHRRQACHNPFRGHSREALCCVVFDESGLFTMVERYAAYEAMRQSDSDFFIKLIATTRGVVERRIVFYGLLEHFDRLLPIEQCIYPDNYRQVQQAHLQREERLYGPLLLDGSLAELLESVSPLDLLRQVQSHNDGMR
ncbi:hypothetical protein ACIPL1_01095 [Pseudomonas sp. NPDC090202]|uniref:hypothetical protein n=1 Tax=unclassified Pseudomonas TaxID=196821 RepID=UPI0037F1A7A2